MTRDSRDGNPGTTNAFLYGGFGCGVLTLCGDVGKGLLPVYLYAKNPAALSFPRVSPEAPQTSK